MQAAQKEVTAKAPVFYEFYVVFNNNKTPPMLIKVRIPDGKDPFAYAHAYLKHILSDALKEQYKIVAYQTVAA